MIDKSDEQLHLISPIFCKFVVTIIPLNLTAATAQCHERQNKAEAFALNTVFRIASTLCSCSIHIRKLLEAIYN